MISFFKFEKSVRQRIKLEEADSCEGKQEEQQQAKLEKTYRADLILEKSHL